MSSISIALIVLKTNDVEQLKDFYTQLGLDFEKHQHGKGVEHYAARVGKIVFEIYPLPKSQLIPDKSLRIGFHIENLEARLAFLAKENIKIVASPKRYEWGITAVIEDTDGRKVELTQELSK